MTKEIRPEDHQNDPMTSSSQETFSTTTSASQNLETAPHNSCGDKLGRSHQARKDYWTIENDELIRVHVTARRLLFTPGCALDCPVDATRLQGRCITEIKPVTEKSTKQAIEDNAHRCNMPNKDLEYLWTGCTRFKMTRRTPTSSTTTKTADLFERYQGGRFPKHWTKEQLNKAKKRYKAMPEEFSSRSCRKVITPANCRSWIDAYKSRGYRWQFQELCSGSGRLSLTFLLTGMIAGISHAHLIKRYYKNATTSLLMRTPWLRRTVFHRARVPISRLQIYEKKNDINIKKYQHFTTSRRPATTSTRESEASPWSNLWPQQCSPRTPSNTSSTWMWSNANVLTNACLAQQLSSTSL